MADEHVSQNCSENPEPQEKRVSGDGITSSQEQQILPERLPQSLIEWLARINRRYLALNQEKTNDIYQQIERRLARKTLRSAEWDLSTKC